MERVAYDDLEKVSMESGVLGVVVGDVPEKVEELRENVLRMGSSLSAEEDAGGGPGTVGMTQYASGVTSFVSEQYHGLPDEEVPKMSPLDALQAAGVDPELCPDVWCGKPQPAVDHSEELAKEARDMGVSFVRGLKPGLEKFVGEMTKSQTVLVRPVGDELEDERGVGSVPWCDTSAPLAVYFRPEYTGSSSCDGYGSRGWCTHGKWRGGGQCCAGLAKGEVLIVVGSMLRRALGDNRPGPFKYGVCVPRDPCVGSVLHVVFVYFNWGVPV
eukprot:Sspe_Gene.119694::Locus_116323_Transcript_1_1_Confidence_1.000_Length_857::g.119694::m.119694